MQLSIGELADRAGVTRRTIRYYVEIGLLQPPAGAGKAAVYSPDHLERLELIKTLQGYRLSLEEIRDRLAGKPGPAPEQLVASMPADAAESSGATLGDTSSAAQYIAQLRSSRPFSPVDSMREIQPGYMQSRMWSERKPPAEYDTEPWLRIRLSEDVELHVRRRASKTDRRLNRLIKEARRILAEEEVE
jgi:DNA-binding transcriptional MerR regulator